MDYFQELFSANSALTNPMVKVNRKYTTIAMVEEENKSEEKMNVLLERVLYGR